MGYSDPDLTVVSLSGGLDSTTALASVLRRQTADKVMAVTFDYGSKHGPLEVAAAKAVTGHFKVNHLILPVHDAFQLSRSALLARDALEIPEGHYAAANMAQTVVPARNLIFATILAGVAQSVLRDAKAAADVVMSMHAGDHAVYPDCRPGCVSNLAAAVLHGTGGAVRLVTPFLFHDKKKIVRTAVEIGAPLVLTRTCYTSGGVACGKCGACVERRGSFESQGLVDPIPYLYTGPLPEAPGKENRTHIPTT